MEVKNNYVTLKNYIEGSPTESDFEIRNVAVALTVEPGSKDVIVKNLYLSIDPYQMNRMKKHKSSEAPEKVTPRLVPGKEIDAHGVGRVVASDNEEFEKDDLVVGIVGWQEYSVVRGGVTLRKKIESTEFPLSYELGVLGFSGFSAYLGFYDICKPKKGEKVFVSAASGSVGNIVGQYAKLSGCYVVGCAGSKQKVDLLKEKLGFDDAFNYKEESDLKSTLKRYFPDGIDIYFDNVGSEMLEAAVANMNNFGRVAMCGVISEYTDPGRRAAPNMIDVVYKRITIQGFLTIDNMHLFSDFTYLTSDHIRHGQMLVLEDISQGLESFPSAFAGLFRGDNVGKKIVQITDE
eukprot:TRINITY_DN17947_c0_g1_i1.p1 TRINITY_DN17947_c0_g1~~TRINITY_DN17947_c0_g1_i1.p1  ORF type:complete len:348 (-),score=60.28 TRINITY_DN17947_c0_g1_i1:1380-2423(-)